MNRGRTPLFRSLMRAMQQAAPSNTSRRNFLRLAGAAGAAVLVDLHGKEPGESPLVTAPVKIEGPVAIVGGGVAGLTAAYRLVKAGVEVHLYEASTRFGGRMFTKHDFNKEGMFVELGGELVDSDHTDLIELAKELGVGIQPLKEGEQGLDFYSFGGKIYTDHDVVAGFGELSKRIAADAEGLYDEKDEFTEKAHKFDKIDLKTYLQSISEGVDPWIIQMLEMAYVPEFGVELEKQSALNLIDFINPDTSEGFQVFGASDEAWRVQGGNESLPAALHKAISKDVKIRDNHKLVKIADDGSKLKLSFLANDKLVSESYNYVIVAIPFTMLRGVEGIYNLKLSEDKARAIKEMGYGTNVKVMYGFTDRMWRNPVASREFICNGSVYATSFQNAWETSRGQNGNSGIITNFLGGSMGAQYTPDRMEKFLTELDGVFPGLKAKHDGNKTMMNWPSMKLTKGSYSATLVGQYTWIYDAAATSELDGRLHFAGEQSSTVSAGYMNGGVESGNRAAKELLGVPA